MTLQEFAALKPGDKVTNPMQGSSGEVTEISEAGVRVAWGGAHAVTFMYGVGSTAWMHWAFPPRDCTSGPCTREDCRRADQCLAGDYDKIAAQARGAA